MKISKSTIKFQDHQNQKDRVIDNVNKGVTERLLEKYKCSKSLFPIENMSKREIQKRAA